VVVEGEGGRRVFSLERMRRVFSLERRLHFR